MMDMRFFRYAAPLLLLLLAPPACATTRNIWLSAAEIRALPMTGGAWTNVRSAAYGSWGTPNIADQEVKHGVYVLAGALVYVRTGDATLRAKVRDGIIAAKRTHDEVSEYGRTLSLGRQLGAYVIAADLIDLQSYDAVADAEFRPWVSLMRTVTLPLSNTIWATLRMTDETTCNNWGSFAGASLIAADLYLGDLKDVARRDSLFRAYADRAFYPSNAPGKTYFEPTMDYDATLACSPTTWTAIDPACVKTSTDCPTGLNLDGALVEDLSREPSTGPDCHLDSGTGVGASYSWETLQGFYVQAELLYRAGYTNAYAYGNNGLKRAMQFMERNGGLTPSLRQNVMEYVPWIANRRYGTNFSTTTPIPVGRVMGWTDWTHAAVAPSTDKTRPAPVSDLR